MLRLCFLIAFCCFFLLPLPDSSAQEWFETPMRPGNCFTDLSPLNHKPAGIRGLVRRQEDKLVFGDGSEARFWGVDVQAYSLFTGNKLLSDAQAVRLAKLGCNLVRLHHHDSAGWIKNTLIAAGPTSQKINEQALDSYFYFIAALKKQGIYVWVDLHTSRLFREGDQIPGFTDKAFADSNAKEKGNGADAKGLIYLNERVKELYKQFARELLTRVNPYTKLALKDDPAVAFVLLTNENELTQRYGNTFLADKGNPYHTAIFDRKRRSFAQKNELDFNKVGRTWEPGESKLFLNDLEHAWDEEMIVYLRRLGVKQLISTCHQWTCNYLYTLPALTAGDVLDAHSYAHPDWLRNDPRQRSNALIDLCVSQVNGYPFTITEWNTDPPAGGDGTDHNLAAMAFGVASQACLQGWDALMLYGYSQDSFGDVRQGKGPETGIANAGGNYYQYSSHSHPALMGFFPALALIYRQGHLRPANHTVVLSPTREQVFLQGTSAGNSAALRTVAEQHRVLIGLPATRELPWLVPEKPPVNAEVVSDLTRDFIPAEQTFTESDTGEYRRDWSKGILTLNSPKSQGAFGNLKGERVTLRDIEIQSNSEQPALLVTSLENQPVSQSRRLLITAVGRVRNTKPVYLCEPVQAKLKVRTMGNIAELAPLNGDGSEQPAIRLTCENGVCSFDLPVDRKTHWFVFRAALLK